jgi:hypothetical protein
VPDDTTLVVHSGVSCSLCHLIVLPQAPYCAWPVFAVSNIVRICVAQLHVHRRTDRGGDTGFRLCEYGTKLSLGPDRHRGTEPFRVTARSLEVAVGQRSSVDTPEPVAVQRKDAEPRHEVVFSQSYFSRGPAPP